MDKGPEPEAQRPATLGAVVRQLRAHGGNPLLVTDHVTPPLAEALRAQGVEFLDAVGNAFLNQPPLLVFVNGQQRIEDLSGVNPARDFGGERLDQLPTPIAVGENDVARPLGQGHL